MNLPGFHAEASSGQYRTTSARRAGSGMVRPAQSHRFGRANNTPAVRKTCQPGTICWPVPDYPSCQNCIYHDEYCNEISWQVCDPYIPKCAPMEFCEPSPLDPFCEICTVVDERCQTSTYQYCTGVPIPNKTGQPGRMVRGG